MISLAVQLNQAQRDALSFYFSSENTAGEEWSLSEPLYLTVERGQLRLNGAYLHSDGEFATYPEPPS